MDSRESTRAARGGVHKILFATAALIALAAITAEARPHTLQWDANTDGVTAGYFVYVGSAPGVYQPVGGTDVGNVTEFQVDLTPGQTYYFAVRAYDAVGQFGPSSSELAFQAPLDPAIQLSTATPAPGSTLTATVTNGPGLSRYDWVAVYPVGNSVTGFLPPNKYLSGTQTPPPSPLTGGTVPFIAPSTPGQYNVRFNSAAGSTLATSITFTVGSNTVIASSTTTMRAGASITAAISGAPGTSRYDWVGFYPVANGVSGYVHEKYLNDSSTPPAAPMTSGSVNFATSATLPPGTYNIRLISAAGATIAMSAPITVTAPAASVTASPTSIQAGGMVTAVIAGSPGTSRYDWVGFYPVGNGYSGYVYEKYLNNSNTPPSSPMTAGTVTFTTAPTLPPGTYNVRLNSASGTTLATSGTITVTSSPTVSVSSTSFPAGSSVTATVTNSPGTSRYDWVGFYPIGNTVGGYLDLRYLNGSTTAPASPLTGGTITFPTPASLAAGQYNIRLIAADGTQLAVSQTMTVTSAAVINLSATTVKAGATISVTIVNGPGARWDWAGLFPTGNGSTGFVDWKYLNNTQTASATGMTSATITFTAPKTTGQYNVRFFSSYDPATPLAVSATITVKR